MLHVKCNYNFFALLLKIEYAILMRYDPVMVITILRLSL